MAISSSSIRLRLVLAALVMILTALGAAGAMLVSMFEHHVERRLVSALETDVRELIAGLTIAPDGAASLGRQPAHQRYSQPFSGSYWQVANGSRVVERSRSLWDEALALPAGEIDGGQQEHVLNGPQGRSLIAVERHVVVERAAGATTLRFVAAQDRSELDAAVSGFRGEITRMLVLLGGLLLGAFALAVAIGLGPLSRLRTDLAALRSGEVHRLAGRYPSEVARLVEDLNHLLDYRDSAATRAGRRAADLAHGLKTPITAISVIAAELAGRGETALAGELAQYAGAMHRHVERELALARSAHAGPAAKPTALAPIAGLLVDSLKRLPRGADLSWHLCVPDDITVAADTTAIAEILGNLLDNARKWATRRVEIRATIEQANVRITVSDDGPGVDAADLPTLTDRGRRLDSSKPGSGLGLSIAREIVEHLGGSFEIVNAASGGLVAAVSMPTTSSHLRH